MSNLPAIVNTQTSLSTYDKVNDPMAAAEQLGVWIAKSGMFGCERPEQGAILAMQCIVERKAPLELAKHYHIIGGRLSLRADAMLALYRERGGKVQWQQFDANGAKARWIYDGNDIIMEYTTEDAKQAGLLPARAGSGWAKFPAEMMRARLISKAVRMLAPEVCTGAYTPEEIADFDQPKPSTRYSVLEPVAPDNHLEQLATAAGADVVYAPRVERLTLPEILDKHGANLDQVHTFLVDKKWIPAGGTLTDIAPARVQKILDKPEAFLAAVRKHCAVPVEQPAVVEEVQ